MAEFKEALKTIEAKKEFFDKTVSEGIEKYRKGDAEIVIVDKNGNKIKNAKVKINQTSHEFRFGANLFMLEEFETEEKNTKYKQYFKDVFNMATLPFYWCDVEPKQNELRYDKNSVKIYRRPSIDLCMEYCRENGIEPREHALAYEHFFPEWLKDKSVDEIKFYLEKRYKEISERYADKINTIEVTNEMYWDKGTTKIYEEPDYIKYCFDLAKKYFPNNQLGINEYTDAGWLDYCRTSDRYYSTIEANILKGAKIDAIGMQYHLFINREDFVDKTKKLIDPENLYKHLDLYSHLNRPIQVTEMTIPAYSWNADDEEVQAKIVETLYSIWFAHPNVEQIIYWNLVDGYAYLQDPSPEKIKASQGDMTIGENYFYGGLLRFDMTPKPAYFKIKELLNEKWHTSLCTSTDNSGVASFRGFFGNYDLEIEVDGKKICKSIFLSKKKNESFVVEL